MITDESESLIIPSQLRAARDDLALPVDEVASELGIEPEELIRWEGGFSEPPVERLWALAELYQRDTDYFLRQAPSLPDQLSFRLARRKAMKDLPLEARKALVRFDELCRAQSDLERLLGRSREIQVERYSGELSPEEIARSERGRLGLGERPVRNMRSLLTNQGVRVFELPIAGIPGNELSGLSWWHQNYGPCILVNARDIAGRRSFTMAHEYAHLLRSDPPMVCDLTLDTSEERSANRFAAEFLMPASDVEGVFLDRVGLEVTIPNDKQLGSLARRYGVSLEAAGRRLEELGFIPSGTIDARISEWEARPTRFRRPRTPTWQRRLGDDFVSLALSAHSQGHVSLSKLATYLGLDVRKALEASKGATASR